MSTTYFEFREAKTTDELRAIFKLRYRLYRDSRLKDFCEENEHEVDIDSYETFGKHMGLFKIQDDSSTLVGFHRPIFPKVSKLRDEILAVAAEYPSLHKNVIALPNHPLPLMNYSVQAEPLRQFYHDETSRGATVIEATKFAIEPKDSSLGLAKHVIDAEHAIQLFCNGADISIMGINSSHLPLYKRYGYELIPGTTEFEIHGVKGVTVHLRRSGIPSYMRQRLLRMAVAYLETGKVCYNPAEPNNFYAPQIQEIAHAMRLVA
jgi:hypothetical protein